MDLTTKRTIAKVHVPYTGQVTFTNDDRAIWIVSGDTVGLFGLDLWGSLKSNLGLVASVSVTTNGLVVRDPNDHLEFLGNSMRELRPALRCRLGFVLGPPEACEDAVIRPGMLRKALDTLEER